MARDFEFGVSKGSQFKFIVAVASRIVTLVFFFFFKL